MNPGEIRANLQAGILEFDDGTEIRGVLPSFSVLDAGAKGDGVTDDTEAFRRAIASLPATGARLVVPWTRSFYKMTDTAFIARSNVEIELQPGAWIKKDSSTNVTAPFRFQGATPGTYTNLTADASKDDITVTVTSTADLAVDDWVEIEDDEPPATGSTGTHHEINRIRGIVGTTVSLYYQLCDDYVTISAVAPKLRRIIPVVSSGIVGRGKIQNGDSASVGNAGVDFSYCVGGYAKGIEFEKVREDCVRYNDSMSGLILGCYMHDAVTFDQRGRGVSSRGSTHVIVANNNIDRTRHSVDISFFTQYAVVTGNTCRTSALTPLKAHPNCHHVWFVHNVCDGVYGYDASGSELGTNTEGVGVSIDQSCRDVIVSYNEIANVREDGVLVITKNTYNLTISYNKFSNWNVSANTTVAAAIRCMQVNEAGSSTNLPGYVVEGNEGRDGNGRFIAFGMNGGKLLRNKSWNVRGASGNLAHIVIRSYDAGASVTAEDVLDVEVAYNSCIGGDGHAIEIGTSDADVVRVNAHHNFIRDMVGCGIQCSPQFTVDPTLGPANDIANVNNAGSGDNDYAAINHYSISTAAGAIDSGQAVIVDNILRGVMRYGVQCNASGAIVKSNKAFGVTSTTGSIGIAFHAPPPGSGHTTADQVWEDNFAIDSAIDGLRIGASSGQGNTGAKVRRNTAIGSGARGINIQTTSTSAEVDGNYASESGTADYADTGTTTVWGTNRDGTTDRTGFGTKSPDSPWHFVGNVHFGNDLELDGALNHDGSTAGFYGTTPAVQSTGWSVTNETSDKSYDADATSVDELADVLGTLIEYLKTIGLLGA